MRISDKWLDYELIDCTDSEKLERFGDIILIRPDPQAVWKTGRRAPEWNAAHGRYLRSDKGGGRWEFYKKIPPEWTISYGGLKFKIKPTGFKHTGIFPEQAANWDLMGGYIKSAGRPVNVLNLFAYTGGATLACAKAGASVCHVDASKGMVAWAKENASLSDLSDKPVRWIIDDCEAFIRREIKRGRRYDAIIMDPPSYGRGPNQEIWKLEDNIYGLVKLTSGVLSENPLFYLLNSYTTGFSPSATAYILSEIIIPEFGGSVSPDEIGLPARESGLALPCGSSAVWTGAGVMNDSAGIRGGTEFKT